MESTALTNCVANWPLILEYLKVILSWPPLTIALLAGLALLFRQELGALIKRIRSLEVLGGKVDASLADAQIAEGVPSPPEASAKPAGGQTQGSNSLIDEISSDPVRAKAEILKWWSIAKFESVMNVIFSTQLRLLVSLAQQAATGQTLADLMPFYLEHKEKAGDIAAPMGNYFSYLTSNELMRLEGEGIAQRAFLTDLGRGFLHHVDSRYGASAVNMRAW